MLYKKTVEPRTFSLLKELMLIPELADYSLVGGTALALKYGHRISIDLDLFSDNKPEKQIIEKSLRKQFGDNFVFENSKSNCGIFCYINNIKVDIVSYPHPTIATPEISEGIRFYSDKDLMAMKVQAILGRGKKKDFWDIAELLQHHTLQEMIDCHKAKYPSQMLGISIPNALTYFVDADESEDPETIKPMTWNEIKAILSGKVRDFLS